MSINDGYAVVEFTDENEVDVVPVRWLANKDTMCQWPTYRMTAKITKAVKANIAPNAEFRPLSVRVLAKTADYNDARKKLSKATYSSDLQTDAEENENVGSRKTKRPSRFESSDSENDQQEVELNGQQQTRKSPRKIQKKIAPPSLPSLPTPPSLPSLQKKPKTKETTSSTTSLFDKTPSSSAMEKRIINCLEKIMTNVEEIKVQMHLNTQLLQATMTKVDGIESRPAVGAQEIDSGMQLNVCFPLETQEDVEKLEDILQDKEKSKTLVRSLSTIGGENTKATVRRLLSHMIKNPLATKINWVGKGGKIAFSSLKLKEVLKETVRKNRLCPSATDAEIYSIAKDWFRFASDRDGGRKRRAEKKRLSAGHETDREQEGSEPEDATQD